MAIPDNPHFTQSELNRLNTAFRGLGLTYAARVDVANYIGTVTPQEVQTWQSRRPGAVFAPRWADDYTKAELIAILGKITKAELRQAGKLQGIEFYARATKPQMVYDLTHAKTKEQIGAVLDSIRPRPMPQTDALPASIYLGHFLSSFPRGTEERRRADVVLALLSEVHQNPECTGGEDFELDPIGFASIADAEDALIWPLRQGTATASPLRSNPAYVNEAWNTVQLWRIKDDVFPWQVTIWLYTNISEESNGMYQTGATGWPTRPTWGELRKMREDARKAERAAKGKKGKGR